MNDGGAWTREHLSTAQTLVHARLVVDWAGAGVDYFGLVNFDGVVGNAQAGDVLTNMQRVPGFQFSAQTITSQRFGNVIKIDDATDFALPGAGAGWVKCEQPAPELGSDVDRSRSLVVFSFDMNLDRVGEVRSVGMVLRARAGGTETALLYSGLTRIWTAAEVHGVDIEYVPAPSAAWAMAAVAATSARRRR